MHTCGSRPSSFCRSRPTRMLKSWSLPPISTSARTTTLSQPCMIGYWISCRRTSVPLATRFLKSSRCSICWRVTRALSLITSMNGIALNQVPLNTTSVFAWSSTRKAWSV